VRAAPGVAHIVGLARRHAFLTRRFDLVNTKDARQLSTAGGHLLDPTWLELPSRPINKKVFQDVLAFAALQWRATVVALYLTV
jgi:hypothetical protein